MIKMKAISIFISALGDVTLSVCMDQGKNPFCMIGILNARFHSNCSSFLFAVLSILLGKRHNRKEDMTQYID